MGSRSGNQRLILVHDLPDVPFQGHTLQRTVPPGLDGIILCAPNGDEVGDIATSGSEELGHSLMALDYRNVPLKAVANGTRYRGDRQSAGLVVMNDPSAGIDAAMVAENDPEERARLQAMMVTRVTLGVEGHHAALVLTDRAGRERIVMGVDPEGVADLRVLDEEGNVTARFPGE